MYMCARCIDIASLSNDFLSDFGTVVMLWYNAFFKGRILWLFKKCALFRHCFVLTKREIVTMIIMRLYLKSWMPFFGTFSIFQLKISVAQIETNLRFTASDYPFDITLPRKYCAKKVLIFYC